MPGHGEALVGLMGGINGIRKLSALYRAFLAEERNNLAGFVITLVLPSLLFVINNIAYAGRTVDPLAVLDGLSAYLSYIVFVSVWNGVAVRALVFREDGALQRLAYASGSWRVVLFANACAQVTILAAQTVVFVCVAQLTMRALDGRFVLLSFVGALLGVAIVPPCLAVLRLRVPPQTANMAMSVAIACMFVLAGVPARGLWVPLAMMLDPIRWLWTGMATVTAMLCGMPFAVSDVCWVAAVGLVYAVAGAVCLYGIDIRPIARHHSAPASLVDAISRCLVGDSGVSVLLGANGAGKTMVLDALAVRSARVPDGSPSVAYLTQRADGFAGLRVGQMVALYRGMAAGESESESVEMRRLRQRHLTPIWDSPCARLSGGERQTTMLYCTCLLSRDAYLFDEPTQGMDPASRADAMAVIRALERQGKCIVMVTHIQTDIEDLDNPRIIVMRDDGSIWPDVLRSG
ncbi:ATP-binding cassette domain-containing protein [Bifidobacterium eulemuris]|nr:ATP-binding cassette domain-containing protein [Bifidobacterium eulemuris]